MTDGTDGSDPAADGPRVPQPRRPVPQQVPQQVPQPRRSQDLPVRLLAEARNALAAGEVRTAALLFGEALAIAEEHSLADEHVAALLGLGDCELEGGELGAAREHFEAAEKRLAGEPLPRRAAAIRGRAVSHLLAGELRYACYLLENAIEGLQATGEPNPDALLLLHTAVIAPYMDMGALARAAQAAELALALAPCATDPALVAGMHRSVARTLIAEGRIAEAGVSLAKAQELYQRLGLRSDLAKCHWMRGYVHAQGGNLEHAERELRIARNMLASLRSALFTDQVEVELADVLRRRGSHTEAGELLAQLLDRIGPERGAIHAAGAHRLLGLIAQDAGELDAAEEHYVNALSLLERAGAAGDLADLCRLLGDLLRRTGRVEAALDAYRTGLGHRAAIGTTTLGPAPPKPPVRPPSY
ncbi:tetratricopeptide repeat protein [Streptomyces sp. H10-C2]|uniref:tetratricopeptide repeat protein n=1 Tax=unclassified Streptomyces TaxID=2593676 RepID=UPI0024BAB77C|nr:MULTISPECIES: tetratricopeptide repeat protein [unclassified Streptomyces]MDJ0342454.1 tetratricopeptide repeat protein [Streptomyces sp. PH10-H1]MDJ0372309.1 tetratricopeptide repeat protein [Streptomyces sp. H10-C2]